jgi:hypothetical protein
MGRHSKHYNDLNPLEGGGSGGGSGKSRLAPKIAGAGVAATVLTPGYMALQKAEDRDKLRREAPAEIKRESRGKEDSMTAGQKQSMQEAKDEEEYQKRKTAPTTKTEMGKGMKKGGMTASSRADGCATKGKTRGKMV